MQTIQQAIKWKKEATNGNFKKIPEKIGWVLKLSPEKIKKEINISKISGSVINFSVKRLIFMELLDENYELTELGDIYNSWILNCG